MGSSTGLLSNIRSMYHSYGGALSFICSGYVWIAIVCAALSWKNIQSEEWASIAINTLPTLAGFSIAAYAIFFSVLSDSDRKALMPPHKNLGGRSPFLVLVSAVSHAVLIQLLAILIAIIFKSKSIPIVAGWEERSERFNTIVSTIGWFLTLYGIILVAASVLSIFRILEIKSR